MQTYQGGAGRPGSVQLPWERFGEEILGLAVDGLFSLGMICGGVLQLEEEFAKQVF
jgi:hypothetical protein